MKTKNVKKNIANTESNKEMLTKYARKREKEETETEDGEALDIKPKNGKKKNNGVVALKHSFVIENMRKNVRKGGKLNKTKAMIDSGYSPNYAKSGNILRTKSWQDKTEVFLEDTFLLEIHNDLVVSKKLDYMLFNVEISDENIYDLIDSVGCVLKKIIHGVAGTHVYYFAPDNNSKIKALELAYKIKGKMSPEVIEVKTGLSAMSDAELAELIRKQKKKFTKND